MSGWKSRKIENIWFSLLRVWLKSWKSGRVENSFVWLKRKGMMENVIYKN